MSGRGQPQGAPATDKRAYYHLFFAQALALVSTGIATVALALLAYDLAGADAWRGAPHRPRDQDGRLSHRRADRGRLRLAPAAPPLLVGLDLARAAIALALPFVTQVWHVYVLIFAFQAASAAFTPTYQATIPDLLPEEKDYTTALARSRLAHELEGVISPVLAAALLVVISFPGVFVAAVIGLLASAGLILGVSLPESRPATAAAIRDRVTRGLRIFLATPRLRGLIALSLAAGAGTAMVVVNTVILVQSRFGPPDDARAVALGAFGAGSVFAALLLPRMLEAMADRTEMLAGAGVVSAGLLCGTMLSGFTALLPLWFAIGFVCAMAQTPAGVLLRRSAPREDRQYLYAANFALVHGCLLLTYPLAGWLGAGAGLKADFAVLGLIAGVALVAAARLCPRRDWASGRMGLLPEDGVRHPGGPA
jgi:hypothetical protein